MKKTLMMALMAVFAAAALFADRIVPVDSIPQAAKNLIAEHFPGRNAQFAKADFNEWEVQLDDGTEIEFTGGGEWKGIKCYTGVPLSVLPQAIADHVAQSYPDVPVLNAEKERRGYELKLANRMEMFFGLDGCLLGQKLDD